MNELRNTMTQKEILDLAHNNTLFSQILSLIPGHVFQSLERRHKTGRSSRQFGFKEQFTIMAFIQLAARSSLHDGLRCLSAAGRHLYHWGLKSVARSTVCDANRDRPAVFFQELCSVMYQRCLTSAPSHKFKFKSKLFSLDSSTVSLCLSVFPRASFRSKKPVSRCTLFLIMMATSRPLSPSQKPNAMTVKPLPNSICPRAPSWFSIKPTTVTVGSGL